MTKDEGPHAYFKRVKRRSLGGQKVVGDKFGFRGPPKREPRDGRVIVHNRVAHTISQIPGMHGFRAWTQLKDDDCVVCRCGWAGVKHCRVRGQPAYVYSGGPWGFSGKGRPKLRRAS
jgi:hypothetical protein